MSDELDIIIFRAFIPPIKSAILISGDGNGGGLKLDIPEIEGNVFADLYRMRGQELTVTIARARKAPEQSEETPVKVRGWKEPKH